MKDFVPPCSRLWCSTVALSAFGLVLASGCASPVGRSSVEAQRALADGLLRELREAREHDRTRVFERVPVELDIEERFVADVEKLGGIDSYADEGDEFGLDLLGRPQEVLAVDLQSAIRSAVEHNYALQFARLDPGVAEAGVVRAEAAFDWVFFANTSYNSLESEQISSSAFVPARDERDVAQASLGLRRNTTLGGTLSIQQDLQYTDVLTQNTSLNFTPDPAWESTLTIQANQPLLRGFGTDVAREGLLIARNTERDRVAQLKAQAINTVVEAETAYWELFRARQNLLIVQRLVRRGEETQRQIRTRGEFLDADPAQVADADARVQERRQTAIQSQTTVRELSDRLKIAMSDPRFPVAGELLLVPTDAPVDQAIEYGLFDAYQSALRRRPEVYQALLSLDNTSIRRRVAENGLLPRLDLQAQIAFNDLDRDMGRSFAEQFSFSRQSWLLGLNFELPIGNRDAQATLSERRLQQQQAGIAYQNTVQGIIGEVRRSLRRAKEAYERIGQSMSNRLAAAHNLRVLNIQRDTIAVNSPERLNLEFQAQERLAAAEQAEVAALVDYMVAIANLHAAMGTALERNGVRFVVPEAGPTADPFDTGSPQQ